MKIKEVIEKTGLTDRAVRFYIDEGLVLPDIEESYSGRKSIDFSEKDVERLNNVATLRKAGFSVADIKSIVDDNSTAKNIIEKFIEQAENDIGHKTEIVEKLKGVSFDEEVTLEKICSSLSETVEEKQMPSEDIKLTAAEKILKIIAIIIACSLFADAAWWMVGLGHDIFDVRYIKLTDDPGNIILSSFYLGWVVVAILSIAVIFRNIGKGFKRRTKGSNAALLIPSAVGAVIMLPVSLFLAFCTVTPFCSQTTDPDNYLKLDSILAEEDISGLGDLYEIFPRSIPINTRVEYPDSIKYFYEYTPRWGGDYNTYDVCAEWALSDGDYSLFKDTLKGDFILENSLIEIKHMSENELFVDYLTQSAKEGSGYKVIQKGNWTLIYYKGYGQVEFDYVLPANSEPEDRFEDDILYQKSKNEFEIKNWNDDNGVSRYRTRYDFLICAYNDKEQKVRYIASSSKGFENRKGGPYYLSLEW